MESTLLAASASGRGADRRAYVHNLSLRLTEPEYRRLRRFVTAGEERFGRRLSHQEVIEAALLEYLNRDATQIG